MKEKTSISIDKKLLDILKNEAKLVNRNKSNMIEILIEDAFIKNRKV